MSKFWQKQIERADDLAAESSGSKELLTFYAQLLRAQEGIYEQLRTNMRDEFLLLAIGGSVIWWIILYTMFWVVDGFRSSR